MTAERICTQTDQFKTSSILLKRRREQSKVPVIYQMNALKPGNKSRIKIPKRVILSDATQVFVRVYNIEHARRKQRRYVNTERCTYSTVFLVC